jgi:hypothetical protein
MIEQVLFEAIQLIKNGYRFQALPILTRILATDPRNELAWVWMAVCVDDDQKRLDCLKHVLEINPENDRAKNILSKYEASSHLPTSNAESESVLNPDPKKDSADEPLKNQSPVLIKKPLPSKKAFELHDQAQENIEMELREKKQESQNQAPPTSDIEKTPKKTDSEVVQKTKLAKQNDQKDNVPHWEPIEIKFREPQIFSRDPQDDFFYGFKEKLVPHSRLETGLFSRMIMIDGVKITLFDGPKCIQWGQTPSEDECEYCEFFSPLNCLLKFDALLFEDLHKFSAILQEKIAKVARRAKKVSRVIYNELQAHGRPLHYTVIAKIIRGRYPKIEISDHSMQRYLLWHPELFEKMDSGVFRAR